MNCVTDLVFPGRNTCKPDGIIRHISDCHYHPWNTRTLWYFIQENGNAIIFLLVYWSCYSRAFFCRRMFRDMWSQRQVSVKTFCFTVSLCVSYTFAHRLITYDTICMLNLADFMKKTLTVCNCDNTFVRKSQLRVCSDLQFNQLETSENKRQVCVNVRTTLRWKYSRYSV